MSGASPSRNLKPSSLTITRPDDWHLHLRDGEVLAYVVPHAAKQFARAIIMPNLRPPVTTTQMALAYRERIRQACPAGSDFEPLMTLYLTEEMPSSEIEAAKQAGCIHGVKLYPAGATTNSASGVHELDNVEAVLACMQEVGLPLLVHGEVVDADIDVFDRESVFIDRALRKLCDRFPDLRVVFEHITTAEAVEFVAQAGANVAATITAHHLLINRNALFEGGLRPHHYCLPVAKRERHRQALLGAATSGNSKYFLGTDSAPHERSTKESDCGCAGMYTAANAIELYAEAFDGEDALHNLEAFAAFNGADFYGLARNTSRVTLRRQTISVPEAYDYPHGSLVPFRAAGQIAWSVEP